MATLLEVLDQGMGGVFHRLVPGVKLGRSKGDILIQDPNISSLHAVVEIDNKNQLVLIDLDSANGLVINGRKVKKIALLPGVNFQIGKTLFRVKEVDDAEAERLVPTKSPTENLINELEMVKNQLTHEKHLEPNFFSQIVELEFIAGFDFGKKINLSYGPRTAGFMNLDILIRDPKIPSTAFEIKEDPKGILINSKINGSFLNQQPLTSAYLSAGDVLKIGTNVIKINLRPNAE